MPKRILLADDSITIQKVVELTFSDGDYEVTAVNNGAKAIQKLGEMRPDIILSDIIMPEKNGYEVCEHVKSHPEYRNIPVVLLTGTFEPFDPDRAEKAGCDAVVTKPFESQSLIHKVEELIAAAQGAAASAPAAAPVAAPEPEPEAPSPWMDDEPAAATTEPSAAMPFTTSGGSVPTPPEAFTHDADIFNAAPAPEATTEMPFESTADAPFAGETRAFPRMSFDDFPPVPPPTPDPSPWDEQDLGGETRAFGKIDIQDLQSMQQPLEPEVTRDDPQPEPQFSTPDFATPDFNAPDAQFDEPDPQPEPQYGLPDPHPHFGEPEPESESPFGAPPPAEEFSSETRAFQRMSFDELQQEMGTPAPVPEPEPEPEQPATHEASPWDEPADTPMFGGETRAIPKMSFDDFPPPVAEEPRPEPQAETSPWDEQPAFGGETRAFPKMSFDDLAAMAPVPEPQAAEPEPEQTPAPWDAPAAPAWSSAEEPPAAPVDTFSARAYTPFTPATEPEQTSDAAIPEDLPFAAETTGEPEAEDVPAGVPFSTVPPPPEEAPAWPEPIAAAEAAAEPDEPVVPPPALAPGTSPSLPIRSAELSDDQVDRIARRVVELMSDQVVRNIAWEVIPDLAEMVVKERIRQLESEA